MKVFEAEVGASRKRVVEAISDHPDAPGYNLKIAIATTLHPAAVAAYRSRCGTIAHPTPAKHAPDRLITISRETILQDRWIDSLTSVNPSRGHLIRDVRPVLI